MYIVVKVEIQISIYKNSYENERIHVHVLEDKVHVILSSSWYTHENFLFSC